MFGRRTAVELENSVEYFESFIREIRFSVDFDYVREKSRGNRVIFGFEVNEKVINEREVFGSTEFENENKIA